MDRSDLVPSEEELRAVAKDFESQAPQDVLQYVLDRFSPRIILACSFGAEDVVLLDMIHRLKPTTPLFYLDTDFLFEETYALRDRIVDHYGLSANQVLQVKSLLTPDRGSSPGCTGGRPDTDVSTGSGAPRSRPCCLR